ncbi:hypothetical protein M3212_15570 [Alkalihalobacillus oceani]|uniref:hypothetical protein n=1 Tax=Halalkalibacter oceani TaxID=1653776 RepID=UPI00203E02EB|nr:hypothetical protein [Halalkalibacter oceani]MCM3762191.1 hypothetical protein [Halalkalibacter oceani]
MHILHEKQIQQLVHQFIFLPLARTVFEQDRQKIGQAKLKIPFPYVQMIDAAIKEITLDLRNLRRETRRSGLTVYKEEQGYLVVWRGYRNKVSYTPDAMRRHVSDVMSRYLKQALRQNKKE